MSKVEKRVARADIYERGLRVKSEKNKSGWSLDRKKPADDKDTIVVNKGQEYYAWSLFGESKERISVTCPNRNQLTNNEFKLGYYAVEDRIGDLFSQDFLESSIDDEVNEIVSDIESLKDNAQESLDNMPEQLQEGETGQMLQSRVESLEEWSSNIEAVDLSIDIDIEDEESEEYKEAKLARIVEIIEELQSYGSYEGE